MSTCDACGSDTGRRNWIAGNVCYFSTHGKGSRRYDYEHHDGWVCIKRGAILRTKASATKVALDYMDSRHPGWRKKFPHLKPFIIRVDQPIAERIELE